jgi:hypothetical protein
VGERFLPHTIDKEAISNDLKIQMGHSNVNICRIKNRKKSV